ncbi:unnamed protein product [Cylicocyclus nassatus]|uniref:Uncharacterized protein n=1 Tax=Cylicocyclus nassatus TaxID=53992 RepID=A0AA36H4M8_CYLNA|nr:unnamed protein product [Cylicocyclus nassatus]
MADVVYYFEAKEAFEIVRSVFLTPLMDEPSTSSFASLDSCCEDLAYQGTSTRFASLLSLPCRFKEQKPDSDQADSILKSIPEGLLEELLLADDEQLSEFRHLAIDVLETLLPSCNATTLEEFSQLIPALVHRLKIANNDIDELNSISKCIISLCFDGDSASTEFVQETADVLSSYCVRNPKKFPFDDLLQRLTECMLTLQHHGENYELVSKSYSWPKDIRTLVKAFLKTRTEMLTDNMRIQVFKLAKEVLETLGTDWFAPDVSLLVLLVHLVVVQMRMCLDKPETISTESLAVCYFILESAIRCAEESSFVEDVAATQIANSIHEAALYSIQYLVEAKEQKEELSADVENVIYRFVCCILAIGGAQMLPESLMEKCSSHMLEIFERSVTEKDFKKARLLLPVLDTLPQLPDNLVTLLVDLVVSQYPGDEWRETAEDVCDSLESLCSRVDYYSKETLRDAVCKIKNVLPKCRWLLLLKCASRIACIVQCEVESGCE